MPIVVNTPQSTQAIASVDWADVTNKPSTFPAAPHGPTHTDSNSDPVPNVTETGSGLVPKLPVGSPASKYFGGNCQWNNMPDLVTPTTKGLVPPLPSDPTLFLCGAGPTPTYAKVDFNSLSNRPATYPSDWTTTQNKPATFPSDWNTTANKPSSFPTAAHGTTHAGNGSDPVPAVTTAADGLAPKLSGQAGTFLNGMGGYTVPQGAGDMLRAVYDANGDNIVDHASLADGAPWTGITGKPAAFNPTTHAATHNLGGSDPIAPDWTQIQNKPATLPATPHAATHLDNGTDPISVVTAARTGLAPKLSGTSTTYLDGTGAFSVPTGTGDMAKSTYDVNNDGVVDHAALADTAPWSGISGKPSTFNPSAHATTHISGGSDAIPNASGSASGLLKPISGKTTDFLDGTHTWQDLPTATQPIISDMRLRSFNAIGNPNFEVDQVRVGALFNAPAGGVSATDRWNLNTVGSLRSSIQQIASVWPNGILIPGTSYNISRNAHRVTLLTAQASLAASDVQHLSQIIEGPQFRELAFDVHSLSIMVRTSVAGLKFGITVKDPTGTRSLSKLCTVAAANTWQVIPLANLPIWPSAGVFSPNVGAAGYQLSICLAAGTTYTTPANDTWQNGSFLGALGQDNFASKTVGSTFDIAFIQHEPGPNCTQFIDKPFATNLDECLRFYQKTFAYGTAIATVTSTGARTWTVPGALTFGVGPTSFLKPMAKTPTVTLFNPATGATAAVRDGAAVDHASAVANNPADSGFFSIGFAVATSAQTYIFAHYVADTGW